MVSLTIDARLQLSGSKEEIDRRKMGEVFFYRDARNVPFVGVINGNYS